MKSYIIILLFLANQFTFSQTHQETKQPTGDIIIGEPVNGKVENNIYTCNRFDWKINIPVGHTIIETERIRDLEKKGHEALTKEVPAGIEVSPHPPHLIAFGTDKYNYFSSSFESLTGAKKFTLTEHKEFCKQVLNDTYSKIKQLKFSLTTSDIKIGNHEFYRMVVNLYDAKTHDLLLIQEIYNSFINENLFSVTITYNKAEVGEVLQNNFLNSMNR